MIDAIVAILSIGWLSSGIAFYAYLTVKAFTGENTRG